MSKNLSHLSGRQGLDNNLFEAYAKAAEAEGSPSMEDLEKLRDEFAGLVSGELKSIE